MHGHIEEVFNNYADTNFRYLKATGLVQSKGRGLTLVPEKHVFIEKLVQDTTVPDSARSYFLKLCTGADLPTDNRDLALVVLDDLMVQLNRRGIPFGIEGRPLESSADIALIRHDIEELLSESNEEEYANRQAADWEEIVAYMDLIITRRRSRTLSSGEEIEVPKEEAPAYFEWVLWRAFLAIDNLRNKPYDARRFKIDQDFLPVGTAPGNGPDLIFEFEDYILVVEVTLMDSSRQEAAEGEPVRRHVADAMVAEGAKYGKPVYGLFVANNIDTNTAETFKKGTWYLRDNTKISLDIVPFTLEQFKTFFEALFTSENVSVSAIQDLLYSCNLARGVCEAPEWKNNISELINKKIESFYQYPRGTE